MKIKYLWIQKYKNLTDFQFDLNKTQGNIITIIGENGSGKSNLFEIIIEIFYKLKNNLIDEIETDFSLLYEIENKEYLISKGKYKFRDNKFYGPHANFHILRENKYDVRDFEEVMFPDQIISYYSGMSMRLKTYFMKESEEVREKLMNNIELKKNFLYIENKHLKGLFFQLLSIAPYNSNIKNFIEGDLKFSNFSKIEVSFKNSNKWQDKKHPYFSIEGKVLEFFKAIENTGQMINKLDLTPLFKGEKVIEEKNYILNNIAFENLNYNYNHLNYFEIIDIALLQDLIDIKIYFRKDEKELELDMLSEGQKQEIMIFGLSILNQNKEILYLLDEPDTYLHPKWQQDLIIHLKKLGNENQIIITTHSPFSVINTEKNCSFKIKDNKALMLPDSEKQYQISDLFLNPAYFNLESLSSQKVIKYANERQKLGRKEKLTEEEKEKIRELNLLLFRSNTLSKGLD